MPVKEISIESSGQAGKADQIAGQVDDLHRLAHFQHEDLAALAHGRRLQHQLRGLGNRHEEAGHAGIGDGDRSAAADLVLEDRHDAAVGTQHVAEAHDGEARRRVLRHGVDAALGDLLRHAHDARRMDRLVGGDEDEVLHAELVGQFGHGAGAADVVADRLADVHFHQRHVLVGGRVEHDFGTVLREDLPHPRHSSVMSAMHGCKIGRGDSGLQLAFDLEDAVLAAAHQHQHARD